MEEKIKAIEQVLETIDKDTTAEYMAELLMDDKISSYKMFEELAHDYLNGNENVQKGIDRACAILTGWNLSSIAEQLLKENKEQKEFIPTDKDLNGFKKRLYDNLYAFSEYYPELDPMQYGNDDIKTYLEMFFYWANRYNDGYFVEMSETNESDYCTWLVQEYEKWGKDVEEL